jgi:hypothetical protein
LDAGLLAGGQGAAAVHEQAEGEDDGFGLTAFFLNFLKTFQATFLTAFLPAQPKNLEVGDAAGEVFDGDATHGADLGNGAATKGCQPNSGDHIVDLGIQACAGSLSANLYCATASGYAGWCWSPGRNWLAGGRQSRNSEASGIL